MSLVSLAVINLIFTINAGASGPDIYAGEPYGEALHDIVRGGGIAISHPLTQASQLSRTDAYRLQDGRILIISASSGKLGESYTIVNFFYMQPNGKYNPHVYVGEPLDQAVNEITRSGGESFSHPMAEEQPLSRTDAYRLQDGRILIITFRKAGEVFIITKLLIGRSADKGLSPAWLVKLPLAKTEK